MNLIVRNIYVDILMMKNAALKKIIDCKGQFRWSETEK